MNELNKLMILKTISEEISVTQSMSLSHYVILKEVFKSKFVKALQSVLENRVKRYYFGEKIGPIYIVVGEEKDYLVIPEGDYCSCKLMNRVSPQEPCYHLIAYWIARALGLIDEVRTETSFYEVFMNEFK